MTNFRTPSTALDEVPLVSAECLVGHLGTHPTVTVPVVGGQRPDLAWVWTYLAEAAEFLDVPMPTAAEVGDACDRILRDGGTPLLALDVTVVEVDGAARVLVTAEPVRFTRREAVRIYECDDAVLLSRADDPAWRRLARRTTSRATEDALARWLADRDCRDGVTAQGVPLLGALVFEAGGETCGIEDPEPSSVLDLLGWCGAITAVRRVDRPPARADRVWWISPRFQIHPVSAVGTVGYAVDGCNPVFGACDDVQ